MTNETKRIWGYTVRSAKSRIPDWLWYVLWCVAAFVVVIAMTAEYEDPQEREAEKMGYVVAMNDERVYLEYGTIYAFKSDTNGEYNVIASIDQHIPYSKFEDVIFFPSTISAQEHGYKPSPNFERDLACIEAGLDWYECVGVRLRED